MESLGFMDDLMDFSLDIPEEDDDEGKPGKVCPIPPNSRNPASCNVPDPEDPSRLLPKESAEEEELEWLSNKDAFPAIESCVDILCDQLITKAKHENSDSLLKYSNSSSNRTNGVNSSILMSCFANLKVPVRARSKNCRKPHHSPADISSYQFCHIQPNSNVAKVEPSAKHSTIGRKCQHCGAEKTPQWRAGPHGPKTLCNACGVRYKSGRLVPEYRPASSPTFRSELHSNLHRKVIQMRKQKQLGMVVNSVDDG